MYQCELLQLFIRRQTTENMSTAHIMFNINSKHIVNGLELETDEQLTQVYSV